MADELSELFGEVTRFYKPDRTTLELHLRYDENGVKRPKRLPHPIDTGVHPRDRRFLPGAHLTLEMALGLPRDCDCEEKET